MNRNAFRLGTALAALLACVPACWTEPLSAHSGTSRTSVGRAYLSQPLVRNIFIADPAVHVFGGRIYVYGSHDIDAPWADDQPGKNYAMRDYRVLSMDRIGGPVTVHLVALKLEDVPWANRQMWAPDAAYKSGHYYFYFPAKDKEGVFRIGVAIGSKSEGPFVPQPIRGSFSMDPAVFTDDDGRSYMFFGGLCGGQLQRGKDSRLDPCSSSDDLARPNEPAFVPKVARLRDDMIEFAESPRDATIVDEKGRPFLGKDHDRRFFEDSWLHKYRGTYYFSYSTGDTHYLNYATGKSPYGPFTFRGRLLQPVQGWTTHHAIVESGGHWYLFYHDTQLSNRNNLRSPKVTELFYNSDGTIRTIDPFVH